MFLIKINPKLWVQYPHRRFEKMEICQKESTRFTMNRRVLLHQNNMNHLFLFNFASLNWNTQRLNDRGLNVMTIGQSNLSKKEAILMAMQRRSTELTLNTRWESVFTSVQKLIGSSLESSKGGNAGKCSRIWSAMADWNCSKGNKARSRNMQIHLLTALNKSRSDSVGSRGPTLWLALWGS